MFCCHSFNEDDQYCLFEGSLFRRIVHQIVREVSMQAYACLVRLSAIVHEQLVNAYCLYTPLLVVAAFVG